MGEGSPLLEKKSGSARSSKKVKKKNLVRLDWSGEQESVGSSSAQQLRSSNRTSPNIAGDEEAVTPTASHNSAEVQEQVQDVQPGNGASPKPSLEADAMAPTPSDNSKGVQEQVQKFDARDETSPGFSRKAEVAIPLASNVDPELLKQTTFPRASNLDPEILKLAQAAKATLELGGEAEATIPTEPELSLVTSKSTDPHSVDVSFDDSATAAGPISSPDVQQNDALLYDSHSPSTSGQTGEHHVFQQDQEGQNADNWSSENMRPNAQNLRYGGYPAQPAPQHRNTPLGSGRLQNTSKLGGFEILHLVL